MLDSTSISIKECLKKYPQIIYNFSNILFSNYSTSYKCALVFAVPHTEMLSLDNYKEEKFEALICEARDTINTILADIEEVLNKLNIKYYIPPVAQNNEEDLVAPFSFKFAAVNAGLGWIGKNGVLITEKYGPRVRLSSVLIDYDFLKGTPIIKSKCSENCVCCINACPYKALTGKQWNISVERNKLINYKLCNAKRSFYLKKHNRKNSCGLCMAVCPYGL